MTSPDRSARRAPTRAPGPPAAGALTLLLCAWALGAAPAPLALPAPQDEDVAAAEVSADDFAFAHELLAQLKARDHDGLLALIDVDGFLDEGAARGEFVQGAERADPEHAARVVADAAQDLLREGAQFFFHATLADVRPLPDPDAGRGPRPDRRYLNLLAAIPANGHLREVLVMRGADGRALQLRLSEEYGSLGEPAGDPRLRPTPLPTLASVSLRWPDGVSRGDQADARRWVRELDDPEARLDALDEIFTWPHAAVPALLEAARAWLDGGEAAPDDEQLVARTLEQLTGRPLQLGRDVAAGEAQLAAFLAWHRAHGEEFEPLDPPQELLAALDDLHGGGDGSALVRWEELLAAQQAEAAGGPSAVPSKPAPDAQPQSEPASAPGSAPGSRPVTRGPTWVAPGSRTSPAPTSGVDSGGGSGAEAAPTSAILAPALKSLRVILEGRRTPYPELHDELDDGRRKRLRTWAEDIERLDLSVALGREPEHLVLGFGDDDELAAAAAQLDVAAAHLRPFTPDLAPGSPEPTMVLLLDSRLARDPERWGRVLDTLLDRRVLFEASADALRVDPGGLTLRSFPFVIQPSFDQAGIAAAGDDEFRLVNELAHKLAVCMLSNRSGQLPDGLRWGVGHLAEIDLRGTVYQFNRTGFVPTGDHFDWEQKADRWLDKRAGTRGFSFAERFLLAGRDDPLMENSVLTWSVVDYLCHERPGDWTALLEALAELQGAEDAYGIATRWLPDAEATRALLEAHLDELDPDAIARHLKTHRG